MDPETPVGELLMLVTLFVNGGDAPTAFLKAPRPIFFFFFPFIGSSRRTRVWRMCNSLSLKILTLGRNVLRGFLKESGKQQPKTTPLRTVKAPIRTKSQNQPALSPTP